MEYSFSNIFFGFVLPILIITIFVFWTIKISYTNRFLPSITLFFLSIFVFLLPTILAYFEVIKGSMGFAVAIMSIYYSVALLIGVVVNLVVLFTIKKK
ncbi:hypothetical protein [Jeotgalibacillus proteolyticus]|uniref:hypothetical protein n=1 Tax=Jeotgalibacillus proteolyticus TaxID=2082395 RepID=UPI003CEBE756